MIEKGGKEKGKAEKDKMKHILRSGFRLWSLNNTEVYRRDWEK